MVGGDAETFAAAETVLNTYARAVQLMGPCGSGQLTKMVNQICIAGVLQGLSEGLHFAERAGLDVLAVVDVISKGAAQSWQMENRSPTMAQREVRFRLRGRLDAQGPRDDARGGAAHRRAVAADGAGRSVLRRHPGVRAAAGWTPRASSNACGAEDARERLKAPEERLRRLYQRFPTATKSRCFGPVYSWRGRPILYLPLTISHQCAIQPGVRPVAKITVNISVGMPIAFRMMPE